MMVAQTPRLFIRPIGLIRPIRPIILLLSVVVSPLALAEPQPSLSLQIDPSAPGHIYHGFGAQIWPGDPRIEKVIETLRLSWVRIAYMTVSDLPPRGSSEDYDAYWANTNIAHMKKTCETLQRHSVKMILCNFATSPGFLTEKRLDPDSVEPYARCWASLVAFLVANEIHPTYLELFNEPDGDWNGRVPPQEYNRMIQAVRAELNARGLDHIGIIGPGLAHIDLGDKDAWVEALDESGINALAAWSVHGYEWRDGRNVGAQYVRDCWAAGFGRSILARDPQKEKPVFVTEFATLTDTYNGAKIEKPTESDAFALRVFENALSFLNCGANALIYWQALDMSWEPNSTFGLIAVDGQERPALHALRTLVPEISLGARVLPLKQSQPLYAAAFAKDNTLVIALVNPSDTQITVTLATPSPASITLTKATRYASDVPPPSSLALPLDMPQQSTIALTCSVR